MNHSCARSGSMHQPSQLSISVASHACCSACSKTHTSSIYHVAGPSSVSCGPLPYAPVEDDGEALGRGRGPEALNEGAPHGGAKGLGHALHAGPALHLHALPGLAGGRVECLHTGSPQPSPLAHPSLPCRRYLQAARAGVQEKSRSGQLAMHPRDADKLTTSGRAPAARLLALGAATPYLEAILRHHQQLTTADRHPLALMRCVRSGTVRLLGV